MSPASSFSKMREVGSQNSPSAPSTTVTVSGMRRPVVDQQVVVAGPHRQPGTISRARGPA
jgi:hypothetical protein